MELQNYERTEKPNWCLGCGNFAIINGIKKALTELKISPHNTVLVSGVGCFAKLPYWVKSYGFVGLHGRSLPVAQGIKLAKPNLNVISFGGDGDGYGEGGNHFIHACRRNVNITYIVHNNNVFGLTTGQYSPTSKQGKISKSSPLGSIELPVNPLALALSSGATFVARAYAGDIKKMVEIIKKAIEHPGFALVDIVQPCLTFGQDYNYYQDKMVYLEDLDNYDSTNKISALIQVLESENDNEKDSEKDSEKDNSKIKLGIFYQNKK